MQREDLQELDDILDRLVALGFYDHADALAAKIRARHGVGWSTAEFREWMEAIGIPL